MTIAQTLMELGIDVTRPDDGSARSVQDRQFSVFDQAREKRGLPLREFCCLPPAVVAGYVAEMLGGSPPAIGVVSAAMEAYRKAGG